MAAQSAIAGGITGFTGGGLTASLESARKQQERLKDRGYYTKGFSVYEKTGSLASLSDEALTGVMFGGPIIGAAVGYGVQKARGKGKDKSYRGAATGAGPHPTDTGRDPAGTRAPRPPTSGRRAGTGGRARRGSDTRAQNLTWKTTLPRVSAGRSSESQFRRSRSTRRTLPRPRSMPAPPWTRRNPRSSGPSIRLTESKPPMSRHAGPRRASPKNEPPV